MERSGKATGRSSAFERIVEIGHGAFIFSRFSLKFSYDIIYIYIIIYLSIYNLVGRVLSDPFWDFFNSTNLSLEGYNFEGFMLKPLIRSFSSNISE